LIDEILDNELAVYVGVGLLLLLFGGYAYYAWRRKKALQQIESSIIGGPSLAADSVFGTPGGAKVDTGVSEIQSELRRSGAVVAVDAGEVDPIAEADVYMAYGRDAQAEEILKEALTKDPLRQPIRTKLLEIYAGRKDINAFETVARDLHAATGGKGAEWDKAVALGAQLDPINPLYGGKGVVGGSRAPTDTQVISGTEATVVAAAAAAPDIVLETDVHPSAHSGLDFDLGVGAPAEAGPRPAAPPQSGAAATADITSDLGFDLDLGGDERTHSAPPAGRQINVADGGTLSLDSHAPGAPDSVSSIDFDFELPAASEAAPKLHAHVETASAHPQAPVIPAEASGGIDFDFNMDLPAPKDESLTAPLALPTFDLDLGAPGGVAAPTDARWQEVATKLDLAKAYQEMGDKDGARELLDEVLKEGDAAQQQQAHTMLSALG
jgi:pilus assembly protein FimV